MFYFSSFYFAASIVSKSSLYLYHFVLHLIYNFSSKSFGIVDMKTTPKISSKELLTFLIHLNLIIFLSLNRA